MVTGSNVGLGLEAARWFVKLDAAKVILAVRTIEKGEEAKRSIEASTKRKGVVEVWPLDLLKRSFNLWSNFLSWQSLKVMTKHSFGQLNYQIYPIWPIGLAQFTEPMKKSVVLPLLVSSILLHFASLPGKPCAPELIFQLRVSAKKADSLERLDVLVENAGILSWKFKIMEDNEAHITTNVVSPLLHAVLSLPKLRETSVKFNTVPKLVFTESFTHWMAKFEERKEKNTLASLADEKKANMEDRYNVSKLLGMYSVRKLAELERASKKPGKVVIKYLNPGWVVTNVAKEYEGLTWLTFKIACFFFARST